MSFGSTIFVDAQELAVLTTRRFQQSYGLQLRASEHSAEEQFDETTAGL